MNLIDRNGIVHSDPLHVQRHPEEIDYTRTEHDYVAPDAATVSDRIELFGASPELARRECGLCGVDHAPAHDTNGDSRFWVVDREKLAEALFGIYDHGTQPNAFREADALLASGVFQPAGEHALASTTKSLTDADHDIPRRVRGRDLAYASIARRVLDSHAIQPHFQRDAEQIAVLLAEAARLGYEMGYGAR